MAAAAEEELPGDDDDVAPELPKMKTSLLFFSFKNVNGGKPLALRTVNLATKVSAIKCQVARADQPDVMCGHMSESQKSRTSTARNHAKSAHQVGVPARPGLPSESHVFVSARRLSMMLRWMPHW